MRVLDGGIVENRHFLVMEFFQGQPLAPATDATRIKPEICNVIGYVRQAAGALDYVHRRGVIHGRLQPADLLVNDQGRVKLTGWTHAHTIDDSSAKCDPLNPSSGPIVDSTVCADSAHAPTSGVAADIGQLGQTLAILLAGTCGTGITDNAGTDAADAPRGAAVGDRLPDCIPPQLKEVVARMQDPDPASRYRNMPEVIQALRDVC